jgi:hypothetical protein
MEFIYILILNLFSSRITSFRPVKYILILKCWMVFFHVKIFEQHIFET